MMEYLDLGMVTLDRQKKVRKRVKLELLCCMATLPTLSTAETAQGKKTALGRLRDS